MQDQSNTTCTLMTIAVTLTLLLTFAIHSVYAIDPEDQVSLPNLPAKLEEAFGITDATHLTGGILASLIFLTLFGLPIAFMTRKSGATMIYLLFVGFGVVGFSIAMSWLPIYFILFEGLIVALMFAGGIRDWISGK